MRTNLFFCISTTLLSASICLAGCSVGGDQDSTQPHSSAETASVMAVAHWVKGDPVDISSGVHVVEFWATWCPPCRTSIPHLSEIQQKFADRGVKIIGVSNEKPGTVEPFVEKMGVMMAYTVAIDGGIAKDYMEKYNIGGIPHAFVVKDGKVAWHGHPMAGLDDAIEDALK